MHYTSTACGAASGAAADDGASQSWFYIPLGLLCATIAAASGGLGDNLVKMSYNRAARRKEQREGVGEDDALDGLESSLDLGVNAGGARRADADEGAGAAERIAEFPIGEEGTNSPSRARRETMLVRIVGGPNGSRCPMLAAALPAELMRPYWIMGWLLSVIINSGGVVLAMGLAPASMIIPFAAVHIAFAVTFARIVNKEVRIARGALRRCRAAHCALPRPASPLAHLAPALLRVQPCTLFRALGCAMIMFGILIVLVTDGLVPHQDVTDLATLQRDMMNVPFALLTAAVLCLCLASVTAFATRKVHKRREIAQLAIAVAAGSFGALSNVLGKSAIEIVKELICSGNLDLLKNPIAYAIVGCMIATLLCQVCCLNTGLSNFETMVITSSTNATLTIVGTMESISFMYRYISRESCSQFDSLPLTSLT